MVQLEVVDDSFPTLVTAFGGAVESIQQFLIHRTGRGVWNRKGTGEHGIGREQGNME
jgi:hypothetical protein